MRSSLFSESPSVVVSDYSLSHQCFQPSGRLCYDHLVSHDFPWFPDFMLWSVWKLVPWRRWRGGRGENSCSWRGFPDGSDGIKKKKKSVCNVRDLGSIPQWGRSLREEKWLPSPYSCLGNLIDRGVWRATVQWVTKSLTQPSG